MRRGVITSILFVVAICVWFGVVCDAATMGTAFTYQGRFMDGGTPTDAQYDFEFKVYDALTSGTQKGSAVYRGDVDVDDGHFTVTLDFGASVFDGDARWLQIGVRPGTSTSVYTTLTPRHELTPTPYALRTAGIAVSNGNVGIGTTAPAAELHLDGSFIIDTEGQAGGLGVGANNAFFVTRSGAVNQSARFYVDDVGLVMESAQDEDSASNYGSMLFRCGNRTSQAPNFVISDYRGGTDNVRVHVDVDTGNVGIGTTTPGYLLTTADTGTITAVNLSDVVYVDGQNNRVGIGYADPICDLDIRGSGSSTINLQSPYNPEIEIRSTNGGYSLIDFSNDSSIDYDMRIWLTGNDSLAIDGGNFGVGTATPTERLDVSGVVRCVDLVETSDEQLKADVQPLVYHPF